MLNAKRHQRYVQQPKRSPNDERSPAINAKRHQRYVQKSGGLSALQAAGMKSVQRQKASKVCPEVCAGGSLNRLGVQRQKASKVCPELIARCLGVTAAGVLNAKRHQRYVQFWGNGNLPSPRECSTPKGIKGMSSNIPQKFSQP